MRTDRDRPTSADNGASPFSLPAMSDSYPLDDGERREIDDLLAELQNEREQTRPGTAEVGE